MPIKTKINTFIIDLNVYHPKNSKVFNSRTLGASICEDTMLEERIDQYDMIKIKIPQCIYSISGAFFEELFCSVIKKIGKEKFLSKFIFVSIGEYNYREPLMESIERILRYG